MSPSSSPACGVELLPGACLASNGTAERDACWWWTAFDMARQHERRASASGRAGRRAATGRRQPGDATRGYKQPMWLTSHYDPKYSHTNKSYRRCHLLTWLAERKVSI
jgi:hypothetical protein